MIINCSYKYKNRNYSTDRLLRLLREELPIRDQSESIKWLKDKLNIDDNEVSVVKGLIDNKSLGRFQADGKILLSELADNDTAYHEAFHRVFRMYLSPEERAKFFTDFRSLNNYKLLLEPYSKYDSQEDKIEEYLADEFSAYTINTDLKSPIRKFLDKIFKFLKSVVGIKDNTEFYDRILNREFTSEPRYNPYSSADQIFIQDTEFTIEQKQEIVTSFTQRLLNNILSQGQDVTNFLKSKNQVIDTMVQYTKDQIVDDLEKSDNIEHANAVLEDLQSGDSQIWQGAKRYIELLGIKIVDDVEDKFDGSLDQDTQASREFAVSFEVDPKSSMSTRLKLILASLTDGETSNYKFAKPVSWAKAYGTIASRLAGVPTTEFMNELNLLQLSYKDELKSLLEKNFQFKNEFISEMAKTTNNFYIYKFSKSDAYLYSANANTRSEKIVQDWKNSLTKNLQQTYGGRTWEEEWKLLASKRLESRMLDHLGIKLDSRIDPENIAFTLDTVMQKSKYNTEGSDIYDSLGIRSYVKGLADKQSIYEEQDDLMVRLGDKKQYTLGLNTQQSILLDGIAYAQSKFTPDISLNDKIELIKKYAPFAVSEFNLTKTANGYIINNKWVERILNGEVLELTIPSVAQNSREEKTVDQLDEPDLMSLHINSTLQGLAMSMKHSDRSTFFAYKFGDKPMYSQSDAKSEEYMLSLLTNDIIRVIENEVKVTKFLTENKVAVQYLSERNSKDGLSALVDHNEPIDSTNNKARINVIVKQKFDEFLTKVKDLQLVSEDYKEVPGLNKSLIESYGNTRLALATAFVNEIANHIYESMLFSGDLRAFKNADDLFKRLAPQSSTGSMMVTDDLTNQAVKEQLDQDHQVLNPLTGELETINTKDKLAPDGKFRSVTLAERENYKSKLVSELAKAKTGENLVSKLTGQQESTIFMVYEDQFLKDQQFRERNTDVQIIKKIRLYEKKYSEANENDGQTYMSLPTFKQDRIRRGLWSDGFELVYQIESALLKYKTLDEAKDLEITFKSQTFKPFDLSGLAENESFLERSFGRQTIKLEPMHTLKSQFAGYSVPENLQAEVDYAFNTIIKTSDHVLMPSAIMGTNLQLMNYSMLSNGINFYTMGSANKVGGVDGKLAANLNKDSYPDRLHINDIAKRGADFYNKEGYFNHEAITENLDILSYLSDWDYRKDQVRVGNKTKNKIKGSTQSLKILLSNLIINSEERFPGAEDLINQYKQVIKDSVAKNKAKFLKKINYKDGEFKSLDQLKETILNSTQIKNSADNVKNSIENFFADPSLGLETVPLKNKIENVLYSLITNNIISFDRPGSSYPMAASTGYEPYGSRKFKYITSEKALSDNYTDYYTRIVNMNDSFVDNIISAGLGYKYFEEVAIPIKDIKINKKRKDFRPQSSDYLKDEILNNQKTPILLNDEGELVEGWYRYNSLLAAGSDTIKVYRPVDNKTNIQSSNDDAVKFYSFEFDKDGNVTKVNPAEIIIPLPQAWIKPMMEWAKTDNIIEALKLINNQIALRPENFQVKGLRIPNQQLSSNDLLQIKRFNLPTMQNYVITPTEIVTKVGADYDLDKLNLYWPKNITQKLFNDYKVSTSELEEAYQEYLSFNEDDTPMTFEEYSKEFELKDDETNQLLELEKKILLHPRNSHNLLMPVTDEIFVKGTYEHLVNEGVIPKKNNEMINSLLPQTNVEKSIIFVKGKQMVGPGALTITGNAVKQADKFGNINTIYGKEDDLKSTKLRFKGLSQDFAVDNAYSSNGNSISEVLSQLLSISVDNVKNPVAELQNINMQTIGVVTYLTERFVPETEIIDFINQPIIKYYLKAQKANESLFNKEAGKELTKDKLITKILNDLRFSQKKLQELPDDWVFENKGFKFNKSEDTLNTLKYFLDLLDQAQQYGNFNATQNSDTKGLKDKQAVEDAKSRLDSLYPMSAIPLIPEDTVTRINTEGVIAPFYQDGRRTYDIYDKFYAIEDSLFGDALRNLKDNYAQYERGANKDRIRQAIENDFQLFLIHNYVLDDEFDRLFKGKDSLPNRALDLKNKIPDNLVLQAFLPMINTTTDINTNEKISQLRLFEKELQGLDEQAMSISIEQIASNDLELYKDMVKFLMFQTGLNLSSFNYSKILPVGLDSERATTPEYMYVYQDMIKEGLQQMNKQIQTAGQAQEVFEKFKLLFDLNNARFLKTYEGIHPVSINYIMDAKNNVLKGYKYNGESIALLGNSYQKRYNVAYIGNVIKEEIPVDTTETQEESDNSTGIIPTIFQEEQTSGYRNRTIKNASADATIAIAIDFNSAGEKLTKSSVLGQNKTYISVDANRLEVTPSRVSTIVKALNSTNAKSLNIAGNGIYTMKGKYTQEQVDDFTYDLLNQVLNSPDLKTKITSIRSGGQTGFDEAGIKAGQKLGLPTLVLAPKGWLFRDENHKDISNETQFKERFGVTPDTQLDLFGDSNETLPEITSQNTNTNLPEVMTNNTNQAKKKNSKIELPTLKEEVLKNFEQYFPDRAWMNDDEREIIADLVQAGQLTLNCEF